MSLFFQISNIPYKKKCELSKISYENRTSVIQKRFTWNISTTIIDKIIETNSSFHVKYGTTRKFNFNFSAVFC